MAEILFSKIKKDILAINKKINKYSYVMADIAVNSNYKLNAMTLKIEIKNNKLIIHKKLEKSKAGHFVRRGEGILKLIQLTLDKYKLKDKIIYIYVGDEYLYKYKNLPIFTIAKPGNKEGILFPDQTFIDIEPEVKTNKTGEKATYINEIQNINIDIKTKKAELFFIGQNINLYKTDFNIRQLLAKESAPFNIIINNDSNFIPMNEFSNYKYLLNLSGAFPWSFRFKFLFMMYSLVINVQTINTDYTDKNWMNIMDYLFEKDKDYKEICYYYSNKDPPKEKANK